MEKESSLSIQSKENWFTNPLTWVVIAAYIPAAMLASGWLVAAAVFIGFMVLAMAVNLEIEYDSRTKTINTEPN